MDFLLKSEVESIDIPEIYGILTPEQVKNFLDNKSLNKLKIEIEESFLI